MLTIESQKEGTIFANPLENISIKPIIIGIVLASFMFTMSTFIQNDEAQPNIMLSESDAITCGKTWYFIGFSWTQRDVFQGTCPAGWFPL
jgi:hypothetical protein